MRTKINIKKLLSFVVVFALFATFFALMIEPITINIVLSALISYIASNLIISIIWERRIHEKIKILK